MIVPRCNLNVQTLNTVSGGLQSLLNAVSQKHEFFEIPVLTLMGYNVQTLYIKVKQTGAKFGDQTPF